MFKPYAFNLYTFFFVILIVTKSTARNVSIDLSAIIGDDQRKKEIRQKILNDPLAQTYDDGHNDELDPALYPYVVYHGSPHAPQAFGNKVDKLKANFIAHGMGFYTSNSPLTILGYMGFSGYGYVYKVKVEDRKKCYGKNGEMTYDKYAYPSKQAPTSGKAFQVVTIDQTNNYFVGYEPGDRWWLYRGDSKHGYVGDDTVRGNLDADACELTIETVYTCKLELISYGY